MTKEERGKEKELLLNVLRDGLPYGLQLKITDINGFTFNGELRVLSKNWCRLNIADPVKRAKVKNQTIPLNYIYIKPYLRSMFSMTEEEYEELKEISDYYGFAPFEYIDDWCPNYDMTDWLNKHHFDYRGLIERELAIEAPEEMYND